MGISLYLACIVLLSVAMAGCTLSLSEASVPADVQEGENTLGVESGEDESLTTNGNQKIDLNNMTREELMATIPEFGSRMVREFFEYQPYISIQQFRREIGKYVDEAQVTFYEGYVFVPVDINEADAETLKQIPGIDDAIAEAMMAPRPFESRESFLDALSERIGEDGSELAVPYLKD